MIGLLREDELRTGVFRRRAFIVALMKGLVITGLVVRMYYLQFIQAGRYRARAQDNAIRSYSDAPFRATIYDRTGQVIAANRNSYNLYLEVSRRDEVTPRLARLQRLITFGTREVDIIRNSMRQFHPFSPMLVKENLSWEEMALVEANAPDLPGVTVRVAYQRFYPFGESLSHTLGYVSRVIKDDLDKSTDPLLRIPGMMIGRTGVEHSLDDVLRGYAGRREVEVDVRGRSVREVFFRPAEVGEQLQLTLDHELQLFVFDRLAEEVSAAAVIMNAHNGDVYAQVSYPAYDPNDFVAGFPRDKWEQLRAMREQGPFRNKAISGRYAPGSAFKMTVALAALRAGIPPEHQVNCQGYIELGDQVFHCWKKSGHGPIRMVNSLVESCDVYYYNLALNLGIEPIAKMARELGFGNVTMIDMTGEIRGTVPDDAWKRREKGEGWRTGDSMNVAIGQGFLEVTPMHLATMLSRIVNGGRAIQPHIITQETPMRANKLDLPQNHLDLVMQGLDLATNAKTGTAYDARIMDAGFKMGGKTGTTQVRRISEREREEGIIPNEDLEWRFRDHAVYVGYAPVQSPLYVCAVVVEHGGSGGATAAPIARDLLLAAQIRSPATQPIASVGRSQLAMAR